MARLKVYNSNTSQWEYTGSGTTGTTGPTGAPSTITGPTGFTGWTGPSGPTGPTIQIVDGAINPLSQLVQNTVYQYGSTTISTPTSGQTITLWSDTGPGMILNLHINLGASAGLNQAAILKVYTDGKGSPDITTDLGTLFCTYNDAASAGSVQDVRRTQGSTAYSGTSQVVTHGLGLTPSQIICSPPYRSVDPGSGQRYWISNLTATTFTLNTAVAIGSDTNTFFFWEAIAPVGGFAGSTAHVSVELNGAATGYDSPFLENRFVGNLRFPIPYSNGVVITLTNPGIVSAGSMWIQVGYLPNATAPQRLLSVGTAGTPITLAAGSTNTIFDLTDTAGSLVWYSHAEVSNPIGNNNYTYLECPIAIAVDGANITTNPTIFAYGTEDFFQTGWYGMTRNYRSEPCSILSGMFGPSTGWNGGIDLLQLHGGIVFNNQLQMQYQQKSSPLSTTAVTLSFVGLYYSPA